jgi:hypothetical protein
MTLEAWATAQAARLIAPLGDRSGARCEAEERGPVEELAAFPVKDRQSHGCAHRRRHGHGTAGQPMTLARRIEEVQRRLSVR